MLQMKIAQLRKDKGLTQRRLAMLSSISKSQISRIERNECVPKIDVLCDIAHALRVQVTSTFDYHY